MRPTRLILQGITRYTDRVDLDLSSLPPGLVAVVGPNGAGKSTIMEALCPATLYLEFPSRPGPLYGRANRRDALIELHTEYAGSTWRHLIQVDPGTGKSGAGVQAFLERDGAPIDAWPTPGRSGDYEAAIGALFPSRELTLASVFAAGTGRGNFLELPKAERRDLFTAMLGNQRLQELATRAGKRRAPLDAASGRLQDRATSLAEDRRKAAELDRRVAELEPDVTARAAEVQEARAAVTVASGKAMAAKADLDRVEGERAAIMARRQGLGGRMDRAEFTIRSTTPKVEADARLVDRGDAIREAAELLARLQAERVELGAAWRTADARVKAATPALARARADLAATLARLEGAGAQLQELDRDAEALAALAPRLDLLAGAKQARADLQPELQAARRAAVEAETTARTEQAKAPNIGKIQARLEAQERAAGLLGGVPCRGEILILDRTADTDVDCGSCRFLTDARAAVDEIPKLRAELEAAHAEADRVAALVAEARATRAQVGELDERDHALGVTIAELQRDADRATELRARLGRRGQVEGLAQEDTGRAADMERLATEAAAELEAATKAEAEARAAGDRVAAEIARLPRAAAELQELEAAAARLPLNQEAIATARRDLAEAEAERASIPEPPPVAHLAEAHRLAREAETTVLEVLERTEAAEREARGLVAHFQGQRQALGDLGARAAELEATTGKLDRRRAAFRLVETALGRDGIQALEIDAAGPRVSGLTNALLSATFGGRFAVALRTTRESSDGKRQIETFDLEVLDGLRGGTRDVADLSKGERVLVDEALKLGIACFNAERNGVAMATLYRDECDGGLDPVNASRYPAMLRKALELGGFRNVYFVSHRPEVAAQADALIRISATGSVSLESP